MTIRKRFTSVFAALLLLTIHGCATRIEEPEPVPAEPPSYYWLAPATWGTACEEAVHRANTLVAHAAGLTVSDGAISDAVTFFATTAGVLQGLSDHLAYGEQIVVDPAALAFVTRSACAGQDNNSAAAGMSTLVKSIAEGMLDRRSIQASMVDMVSEAQPDQHDTLTASHAKIAALFEKLPDANSQCAELLARTRFADGMLERYLGDSADQPLPSTLVVHRALNFVEGYYSGLIMGGHMLSQEQLLASEQLSQLADHERRVLREVLARCSQWPELTLRNVTRQLANEQLSGQ